MVGIKWYHASPNSNLDKIGINPKAKSYISRRTQRFVYLGTESYINNQYFVYAPKNKYFIYEVDVNDIYVEELMEDQIRTPIFINYDRIKFIKTVNTKTRG